MPTANPIFRTRFPLRNISVRPDNDVPNADWLRVSMLGMPTNAEESMQYMRGEALGTKGTSKEEEDQDQKEETAVEGDETLGMDTDDEA